jgi:hypothetical protein
MKKGLPLTLRYASVRLRGFLQQEVAGGEIRNASALHWRSGGANLPAVSLEGVHLEQELGVVAGLAQAVDQ